MAIADVAEYAHLSAADVEALAVELDAIRLDIEDSRGTNDRAYIQRAIAVQRCLDLAARVVIGASRSRTGWVLGTLALGTAKGVSGHAGTAHTNQSTDPNQGGQGNQNDNTGSGDDHSGGDDKSGGMPDPDDPHGMHNPDDPYGTQAFTGMYATSSLSANQDLSAQGVWTCQDVPQLPPMECTSAGLGSWAASQRWPPLSRAPESKTAQSPPAS
jgi:hypothetical protein